MITGAMYWAENSSGQFSRVARCTGQARAQPCLSTQSKLQSVVTLWASTRVSAFGLSPSREAPVIRLDCYRTSLAPSTTKRVRALSCLLLLCAAGGLGAEPAAVNSERWPDAVVESVAPDGTKQISRHFDVPQADRQKYVLLDDPSVSSGWPNGIVRWKYNDAGRSASLVGAATAAAAIATVQAAQAKWSAVCNVQFIYEGTTTSVPTPTTMAAGDGVSAVGWTLLSGNTTGIAGIRNAGAAFPIPIVEGDIVFNNNGSFNYDLDVTALHETGHLLGIAHSDVSNVVMSGPPLTGYVSLSTLQPDDIAACVQMYGPPVLTSRTITGTITNGGAVTGVTFCARPSVGVTCSPSDAAGYRCTVPNGWAGTLHSRSVLNKRIPAQIFSAVTADTTRNVTALSGVPSCNLDVDDNGLIEADIDGVAIMRRMMGFSSTAFAGLSGSCAANTTDTAISNATSVATNYNVTGASAVRPTTDGAVILRAMRGLTGSAVTNSLGLAASGATRTDWTADLRNFINTTCGSDFQ